MPGGGRLVIKVEDSGKGFDYDWWLKNLNQAPERQFSGRGIALVKSICEYLTFSNNGATVEAVMYYGDKS